MGAADKRLMVIDDDELFCELAAAGGQDLGFRVRQCSAPNAIAQNCEDFQPAVIVLDLFMPWVDGIEVLRYLADRHSTSSIVLISANDPTLDRAALLAQGLGLNVLAQLCKPFTLDDLGAALREFEGAATAA